MNIRRINWLVIASIVLFTICLVSYIFLFGQLVISVPHSEPLFVPLWAKGELKEGLETFHSYPELINQWGRDDVYKVIQGSSSTPLLVTTLLLLLLYLLTFVALTFSFGLLAIKSVGSDRSADRAPGD